jgi:hypothetical protein
MNWTAQEIFRLSELWRNRNYGIWTTMWCVTKIFSKVSWNIFFNTCRILNRFFTPWWMSLRLFLYVNSSWLSLPKPLFVHHCARDHSKSDYVVKYIPLNRPWSLAPEVSEFILYNNPVIIICLMLPIIKDFKTKKWARAVKLVHWLGCRLNIWEITVSFQDE